jgi:hypothetical protein
MTGSVLGVCVLFALVATTAVAIGHASTTTTTSTTSTTTNSSTSSTSTSTTTTTTTLSTSTSPPDEKDPFNVPSVASYLEHRTNVVTAAVYDVRSGRTYFYNAGVHEVTASMVKIDILADLLWESQEAHRTLTTRENSLAIKMIDDSNNGAANLLWTDIGGRDALDAFNTMIGFKQTIPNYDWGEIETTPRDQLELLKVIVLPNDVLNAASRTYEMTLMEDVISSERFGLGWGSPPRVTVGVKDGYYPETTTGWQINTTGFVEYNGRQYLATIMCSNNPDETYGIATVTTVAKLLWQDLKP